MQARVTRYLNIRTEAPKILPFNNPGFLNPNDSVRIVDTVRGDSYKGNDIWYRIEKGGYVWSGAVEQQVLESALDWWHRDYKIPEVWKELNTWGEGSTIAVIDSGIDLSHPFLDRNLIFARNADPKIRDIADVIGHGTQVTGVICGNRIQNFGVAPRCRIEFIKGYAEGEMSPGQILSAIEAVSPDVDIINISHAVPLDGNVFHRLKTLIDRFPEKVFICATGNDGIAAKAENIPAALASECANVISVAGLNKMRQPSKLFSCRSEHLTLSAPSEDFRTLNIFDPTKTYPDSGTSFAAPLISGLIALASAHLRNKGVNITAPALAKHLVATVDPQQPRDLYGKGIVNPLAFARVVKDLN
jgi:subtilisin family serine protease